MQEQRAEGSGGAPGPERLRGPLVSPYDTVAGAVLRFLMELGAWVLGPWAAVDAGLPLWSGVLGGVALVLLPAVFNAEGDKTKEGVLVPGVVRLGIEVVLGAVVLLSATTLWSWPGGVVALLVIAGAAVTGRRRAHWLLAGAGAVDSTITTEGPHRRPR